MKIPLSSAPLFLLLPLLVNGQSEDTGFFISSNRFEYVVTSTNATPEERHDIAAMLVQATSTWGDKSIVWTDGEQGGGRVHYSHVDVGSLFDGKKDLEVPCFFSKNESKNIYELHVGEDLLASYRNAREFMASHSNELGAINSFLSAFQEKQWVTASPEELQNTFHAGNATLSEIEEHREELVNGFSDISLETPPLVSYFTNSEIPPESLRTNLWAAIPIHFTEVSSDSQSTNICHYYVFSVWIDGKWKILARE